MGGLASGLAGNSNRLISSGPGFLVGNLKLSHKSLLPTDWQMGVVTRVDERGRLVIPSKFRKSMKAGYVEVRREGEKLVLIPRQDPLKILKGKVSRARPLKDLGLAAEEEALRLARGRRTHSNP